MNFLSRILRSEVYRSDSAGQTGTPGSSNSNSGGGIIESKLYPIRSYPANEPFPGEAGFAESTRHDTTLLDLTRKLKRSSRADLTNLCNLLGIRIIRPLKGGVAPGSSVVATVVASPSAATAAEAEARAEDELPDSPLPGIAPTLTKPATQITWQFRETGKRYADPDGDRTQVESESSHADINLAFHVDTMTGGSELNAAVIKAINTGDLRNALQLELDTNGLLQDGVNFLGYVKFTSCAAAGGSGGRRTVPLVGRGTAALEGRHSDAHSGFCVGSACALFQQRVALSLAVLLSLGVREHEIVTRVAPRLTQISACYHGRQPILEYTLECALGRTQNCRLTYRKYLLLAGAAQQQQQQQETAPQSQTTTSCWPQLEHFERTDQPLPEYFTALPRKLTPSELKTEEDRYWDRQRLLASLDSFAYYPVQPRCGKDFVVNSRTVAPPPPESAAALTTASVYKVAEMVTSNDWSSVFHVLGLSLAIRQPAATSPTDASESAAQTIVVKLNFEETGRRYAANDIGSTEPEDSQQQFRMNLVVNEEAVLKAGATETMLIDQQIFSALQTIDMELEFYLEDVVNFFGQIRVPRRSCSDRTGAGRDKKPTLHRQQRPLVLPLSGVGTAALEGRIGDVHAGLCTGPACATFQQRCALLFAIAYQLGVSADQIRHLHSEFSQICAAYHGRQAILDYMCELLVDDAEQHQRQQSAGDNANNTQSQQQQQQQQQQPHLTSYYQFMLHRMKTTAQTSGDQQLQVGLAGQEDSHMVMVRSFKEHGKPHDVYFDKLRGKFTVDQLIEAHAWWKDEGQHLLKSKNRKNTSAASSSTANTKSGASACQCNLL